MAGFKSSVQKGLLRNRDGWMCAYCGRWLTIEDMTIDHVQPSLRGGPDTLENTVLCCLGCNTRKGDMNDLEYKHWLAVRYYAFEIAPNEVITYDPIELVIGKGKKQTSTVIALPALWAGIELLMDGHREQWESRGAFPVMMTRNEKRMEIVFLAGVLYDYYAMKHVG